MSVPLRTPFLVTLVLLLAPACHPEDEKTAGGLLGNLPVGEAQRATLCAREYYDRMSNWYCDGGAAPPIDSLAALLYGLQLKDPDGSVPVFAINGHSSSVVARNTSVLNPRAVVFTPPGTSDHTFVGYLRGEGFAEVTTFDDVKGRLHFYLVTYQTGCEPDCTLAERFLPGDESGWRNVSVYGEDDLHNTIYDCLRCHAPGGFLDDRILRMQELPDPWTHWFDPAKASSAQLGQFLAAHENEDYAAIPFEELDRSSPRQLALALHAAGSGDQPNVYEGNLINGDDPSVDAPNAVWEQLYNRAVRGEAIAPPYFATSPFDDPVVTAAVEAYRAVATGAAPPETMPDLTQLFRADESAQRWLSFRPAAGLTGPEIVAHACGTCHNGRFPGISRNLFDAANYPDNLDPSTVAKIQIRLLLPLDSPQKMPPAITMRLDDAEIAAVLAEIQ